MGVGPGFRRRNAEDRLRALLARSTFDYDCLGSCQWFRSGCEEESCACCQHASSTPPRGVAERHGVPLRLGCARALSEPTSLEACTGRDPLARCASRRYDFESSLSEWRSRRPGRRRRPTGRTHTRGATRRAMAMPMPLACPAGTLTLTTASAAEAPKPSLFRPDAERCSRVRSRTPRSQSQPHRERGQSSGRHRACCHSFGLLAS